MTSRVAGEIEWILPMSNLLSDVSTPHLFHHQRLVDRCLGGKVEALQRPGAPTPNFVVSDFLKIWRDS
jgi:hypothetical protein